ncbi:glycosyltransferase [Scatolibacter rhodanostii]|uniref:glycosyltransferase n=1 Tax=Scatolibacter rhodanostii TaxID=2014781 RepID=UPI00135645A0|nr:glycosyltransferase [Scatolibacter rhodanostii]
MSNKILFLVNELESANGICCKAVMDELVMHGMQIHCISNREYHMKKEFLENEIHFYTVKSRLTYRIDSYINHKVLPHFWNRILSAFKFAINKMKLLLTYPIWPLIAPSYTSRIYRKAKKICREEKINYIIPVYTQIDTLIAANLVKRKMLEITYIPYFLDSLSGGYGPKIFSKNWLVKRGLKWERILLNKADKIIAMESSKEHHKEYSVDENYYNKFVFLDIPLLKKPRFNLATKQHDSKIKTIVYVGTLPEGIRSPKYFLKLFAQLTNLNWQLWFIGTDQCGLLNAAAAKDPRIHIVGRCTHQQALEYEAQADILLNIGNTNPSMTPSKIFEYMSWGQKIVSTYPAKDDPSNMYLKKYPNALLLDESDTNYLKTAETLVKFIENSDLVNISQDQLTDTFYKNTPSAFVEAIMKEV